MLRAVSHRLYTNQPGDAAAKGGQACAVFIQGSHDSRTVEIFRLAICSAVAHRASTLGNTCSQGVR